MVGDLIENINKNTNKMDLQTITLYEYFDYLRKYKEYLDKEVKLAFYEEEAYKKYETIEINSVRYDKGYLSIILDFKTETTTKKSTIMIDPEGIMTKDDEYFKGKQTLRNILKLVNENIDYYNMEVQIKFDEFIITQYLTNRNKNILCIAKYINEEAEQDLTILTNLEEQMECTVINEGKELVLLNEDAIAFIDNIYLDEYRLPGFMIKYLEIKESKEKRKPRTKQKIS